MTRLRIFPNTAFPANGRRCRLHTAMGAVALAALWPSAGQAQTLDDNYWLNVQAYYPTLDTDVRVTAETQQSIGSNIDLEGDLDLDNREVLPAISAGARLGRVILGADFFKVKRSGEVGLLRDITFDGVTYPVSANVESSFSSDIYRLTAGYAFVQEPNIEIGAALGLHATNFRVSLSGEAAAGGGGVSTTTRRKKVFAPLPTLGLFGTWKIAPRLEANARIDYLSLKIDDYDGKLINIQSGLSYRIFDHVSLGLAYRYVDYRLGVDKDSWNGRVRYKLNGPALILQGSF